MSETTQKSNRLEILTRSLAKKQAEFDQRLSDHMGDVRSANGQPLNDKRNGNSTLRRWDQQNNTLRRLNESIKKTERAIERESDLAARVATTVIPDALKAMVASGELVQWRKHPNTFFVPGVDKGRIVWDGSGLSVRYLSAVSKEQYPAFRDAANKARAALIQSQPTP